MKEKEKSKPLTFNVPNPSGTEPIRVSVSTKKGRDKVKIKKLPIHVKKIPATKLLRQFAELDYGGVKEGKTYEPANDNRSLFFKEQWDKTNKEARRVI